MKLGIEDSSLVVIGGGIAGLSAAYYAQKKAAALGRALTISVLERESYWGGKILTDRVGGFVIEAGPDTFLATKPWGVALCRELGLGGRLHGTNPSQRSTYVLHRGRLQPLPDGLAMMVPTQFGPIIRTRLLSWQQKARMGLDFVLPAAAANGDESLGAFVSRRLGRAAYERLIEPLMSGIYAGDGDLLSLQATFPFLRDLELQHGGLVKGVLAMRRKMAGAANARHTPTGRSAFLTPTTGLAEIVEALVSRLEQGGASLRLGSGVCNLAPNPERPGYRLLLDNGQALHAASVILAAPAYAAGGMLAGIDPGLADELQRIEYVTTATISLAYRQEDLPRPLDGYGYVIPRREGRPALACTWTSTKFPHRAPEGFALLRVFVGRAGQESQIPWDEPGLLEIARQELRQTLGIKAKPVVTRLFRWEKAMPQYTLGHPDRLRRIQTALQRWPGLFLAGSGYGGDGRAGIGIPDCIHSGELAAEQALAQPAAIYSVL